MAARPYQLQYVDDIEYCDVTWNYLPAGDIYALVELDEDLLEFFELTGNYSQLVMSSDNPTNVYVIQGEVVFINNDNLELHYTNNSVCVLNQDILAYYKEPLQCVQSQALLT